MTDTGINFIKDTIKQHAIVPPDGMTLTELNAWLLGYATCESDVLEILNSIGKGPMDR